MKLNEFEQSIENEAEKFISLSNFEKTEIESIINTANKTKKIGYPLYKSQKMFVISFKFL